MGSGGGVQVLGTFTTFQVRIIYDTYDVTHMLANGDNAVGVWLGAGWYSEVSECECFSFLFFLFLSSSSTTTSSFTTPSFPSLYLYLKVSLRVPTYVHECEL